ncbi:putative F-box domain-containing protein [Helianthus annuus]|uniref:F-box domain-containing protein n=1 Tax=Helianthus annuus TaxID=4232 RepID=A0A9K3NIP4_HELAN|nr:putative F-box domain-containing protein [Helianthus annuus]KAJ0560208.1 putative F-box domain-containing protein [Helianthus annuus]KAJ0566461.1 putative F-box domain-containing protein [Helianthus annuus]KAJ0573210.1 putative F-box domain-containing protein [Helianthus annuus]KAJ0737628.1 putative F-box domain-containing protein [Helianthus annuus]
MSELLVEILMYGIFTKLSARDIGRCKLVCKKWLSILSTPEFPLIHCRSTSPSATKWVLAKLDRCGSLEKLFYACTGFCGPKMMSVKPFKTRPHELMILGSLDGMLCVCLEETSQILIWNPLTQASTTFPSCESHEAVYIYSTRLHSWRKITDILSVEHGGKWSLGTLCGDGSIVRFDVNLEQFSIVPLPCDFYGGGFDGSLVSITGQLHIFMRYKYDMYLFGLCKLGYEEWINLWVLPCIGVVPSSFLGFVEYVESTDEMLLMTTCGDIYMLDMKTMQVGYYFPWKHMTALQGSVYFESLVSPNY